ncbi:MAG: transposase [Ardenticatenales bacterium]|nr:transposase [Ardenticatenales bacterium]
MLRLPQAIQPIVSQFARLLSQGVWERAETLLVGAILAPGKRTVTSALRVMGLSQEVHFQNYHRVLNRARWSSLQIAQVLLMLLINAFTDPSERLVIGMDDTIERRRGAEIEALGVYRDPVRSSKSHFVKASGLRWITLMLLVPIPWAKRLWALPFLSALAPSKRYYQPQGRAPKTLIDWVRQLLLQLRRWLPAREIVVVADSSYAALDLLATGAGLSKPITMITRLRLDAALYDPAPPRLSATVGRPRLKGQRQATLAHRLADPETEWERLIVPWYGGDERPVEVATGTALWYHAGKTPVPIRWVLIRDPWGIFASQALLSTDLALTPAQIMTFFVQRWCVEVTFQESRAHLGIEMQRQWSTLAIARTTPALLGLFSIVTLFAHALLDGQDLPPRQAAWYDKPLATFSDTLAFVRYQLWPVSLFSMSMPRPDIHNSPSAFVVHLAEVLAFAA